MRTWFALPWIRGRPQFPLQHLPRYGLAAKTARKRLDAECGSINPVVDVLCFYTSVCTRSSPLPQLIRDVPNSYSTRSKVFANGLFTTKTHYYQCYRTQNSRQSETSEFKRLL